MVHLKVVGPWMGFEIQDRTKIIAAELTLCTLGWTEL